MGAIMSLHSLCCPALTIFDAKKGRKKKKKKGVGRIANKETEAAVVLRS